MKLSIKGLSEIRARLEQVRPAEILASALAEQAELLAEAVRQGLSEPQGAGGHDKPWIRTGALRDSIAASTSGLEAAVGSSDPAAAPQEMGTSRIPPRPFLAPAAAASSDQIAQAIGARLVAALEGSSRSENDRAGPAPASPTTPVPPNSSGSTKGRTPGTPSRNDG